MFDNHLCRRKDFEARIGVLQGLQGNKTWSLLTKQDEAIRDSSPKANATSEKVDSRILSSRRFYAYHIWDEI